VRDLFAVSPDTVDFGRASLNARLDRLLELRNTSAQEIAITKLETPAWLIVDHQLLKGEPAKDQPRQMWKLAVRTVPERLRAGSYSAVVVVHTDSESIGPAFVPVSIQVNGPIQALPARLTFDPLKAGQSAEKRILLEISKDLGALTEKDLLVTHTLGDELEVQINATASSQRLVLVGRFRAKRSAGKVEGELEVKTRAGHAPPLLVQISAEVR
jgi:hypothetical protein